MVDAPPDRRRLQVESARTGDGGRMSEDRTSDERASDEIDEAMDKDQDERETNDARVGPLGGFAAGILFGAVLGIGIGLLLAPERGKTTRRRLRKRLEHLREDAEEGLERAGKRTRK